MATKVWEERGGIFVGHYSDEWDLSLPIRLQEVGPAGTVPTTFQLRIGYSPVDLRARIQTPPPFVTYLPISDVGPLFSRPLANLPKPGPYA